MGGLLALAFILISSFAHAVVKVTYYTTPQATQQGVACVGAGSSCSAPCGLQQALAEIKNLFATTNDIIEATVYLCPGTYTAPSGGFKLIQEVSDVYISADIRISSTDDKNMSTITANNNSACLDININGKIQLDYLNITGCKSDQNSKAVNVWANEVIISDSKIFDNTGTSPIVDVVVNRANIILSRFERNQNTALKIKIGEMGYFNVSSSVFRDNQGAGFEADASCCLGSYPERVQISSRIDDNKFINNANGGMKIYFTGDGQAHDANRVDVSVVVAKNEFSSNSGEEGGGAYIDLTGFLDATLMMYENVFDDNSADINGGALNVNVGQNVSVSFAIQDSTFRNNRAVSGFDSSGGDIYIHATSPKSLSGAVYRNKFTGSSSSSFGGSMFFQLSGDLVNKVDIEVKSNIIRDTSTGMGTVAFVDIPKIVVLNNSFYQNTTTTGGSAVYASFPAGTLGGDIFLGSNTIYKNTHTYGGAVSIQGYEYIDLFNNIFWGNTSSSGYKNLHIIGARSLDIGNNIFTPDTDLKPPSGSNLVDSDGAYIEYNSITSTRIASNKFKDPKILETGDYLLLRPTSPAIDQGRLIRTIANKDLNGDDREIDGDGDGLKKIDIGADEYTPGTISVGTVTPVPTKELTVVLSGSCATSSSVTSTPDGINCGSDCDQEYLEGTEVVLMAYVPLQSCIFAGWSGDCQSCGDATTCSVTMDNHKSCTATFEDLTIVPIPNLGFEVLAPIADLTANLTSGEAPLDVEFTCRVTDFYDITEVRWDFNGDGKIDFIDAISQGIFHVPTTDFTSVVTYTYTREGTYQASCTGVNMYGATTTETVTVNVTRARKFSVVVSKVGLGTVTGGSIDCGTSCSAEISDGGSITLTATASKNYIFKGWGRDCQSCGTSSSCTLSNITSDKFCLVTFEFTPPQTGQVNPPTVQPPSGGNQPPSGGAQPPSGGTQPPSGGTPPPATQPSSGGGGGGGCSTGAGSILLGLLIFVVPLLRRLRG